MGYCIELVNVNFKITKKRNEDNKAVKTIKQFLLDNINKYGSGGTYFGDRRKPIKHYAWVDTEDIKKADTIGKLIEAFGYQPEYDSKGNMDSLSFDGEKIGDENILFCAIASCIAKGSFIEYIGEDNAHWRYTFNGEKMIEKSGKVVFED